MRWANVPTPVGELAVAVDQYGVCAVRFGSLPDETRSVQAPPADELEPVGLLETAVWQLRGYFRGELTVFDLPLSVRGGSAFERAVWSALSDIAYAQMRTYGQIASLTGEPGAARAVGVACNHNPLPILIPCHRVVGADGKLVGFGGGVWRKRILLELEARVRIEREFGE